MDRRDLFKKGLTLATGSLVVSNAGAEILSKTDSDQNTSAKASPERRKLSGKLEVSSIGLGVQNMHRTYQTTVHTGLK